jgi:excisionase family DNA binding protein
MSDAPKLLLTPREAAAALSICEKTLWNLTNRGERRLPAVKIGRSVRYSVEALRKWVEQQQGD